MTSTLSRYVPREARELAAYLAEHRLPGRRSMTAITKLRRERAGRQVPPPRHPSIQVRFNDWLLRQARSEIQRRGGEVVIEGDYRDIPLSIVDRDREQRIILVGADGWRHYSRRAGAHRATLAYLYGTDDSGPWAVRVPGTLQTVADALAWLEPSKVTEARAKGRRVHRQGDVYVVETVKAHDGAGAVDLPESHRWNPTTRFLTHHPVDGRKHRPVKFTFPVRFIRQHAFGMGRNAGRSCGD